MAQGTGKQTVYLRCTDVTRLVCKGSL
jgi:hypothetical protein